MRALTRPFRRFCLIFVATLLRISLVFMFLVLVWDAGTRVVAHIAPSWVWFTFTEVRILPGGKVAIAYRQSRFGDLPISVISELLGPDGSQPCANSGSRIIEKDTISAVFPISRTLPSCDFASLPNGDYRLQITAIYPAIGAFDKAVTVISSNAIIVADGAIVGATSVPSVLP